MNDMLEDVVLKKLWAIFEYIGENWQNAQHCQVTEGYFKKFLEARISLDANYKTYYDDSVTEFNKLLQSHGGDQAVALKALYKLSADEGSPIGSHVLKEFIILQVANGGFKVIREYENYRGYPGGSYTLTPPPYRIYEDESDG